MAASGVMCRVLLVVVSLCLPAAQSYDLSKPDLDFSTSLLLNDQPGDATCPPEVKALCPCDYMWFIQERCLSLARHMDRAYNGDVTRVIVSGRYYMDCLKTTFTCEVTHTLHATQILEFDMQVQPCPRAAILLTRYTFQRQNGDPSEPNVLIGKAILREGVKHEVLSAPDHPNRALQNTTHYTEYMTLYFKDHMRKIPSTGEYAKSFHILFEVKEDEDGNPNASPPPKWRQISYEPLMSNCGDCHGGVGCLGTSTSAAVVLSLLLAILTAITTGVLVCRKGSLIPRV